MGGGDKSRLEIAGRSLLSRVIDRLQPQVSQMILNANGDADRFSDLDLTVVPDSLQGYAGPLAGVLAGLDHAAARGFGQIVTVAADTPFFPNDLVARLTGATAPDMPLAMAFGPDPERGMVRHPVFALWPVSVRDGLADALANDIHKVVMVTDPLGCARVEFQATGFDPFFNVNTPADLQAAGDMALEHRL